MATRPIFLPDQLSKQFIKEELVSFKWYAGYSLSQKQKSIQSLHNAALERGIAPILEISSKSENPLGIQLSAFNLKLRHSDRLTTPVEAAYQSSKVFELGGPFKEFLSLTGREIKKDKRLYQSGKLIAFEFENERWPLEPLTAFYDWLYLMALNQNPDLSKQLLNFKGFSDIAFNPLKSFSCQARSAALYVSLKHHGLIETALNTKDDFLRILRPLEYRISNQVSEAVQEELFGDYAKPKKETTETQTGLNIKENQASLVDKDIFSTVNQTFHRLRSNQSLKLTEPAVDDFAAR